MTDTDESKISGNPVEEQVDNFPISDGEVDQPVYEGPQTRSHTKKLMKANILMDQMFDIQSNEICDDVADIIDMSDKPEESIKDLILQFWYQQVFTVYMVCCGLAEASDDLCHLIWCEPNLLELLHGIMFLALSLANCN